MYCPQCGQQQISGEVRFCSRCGFALNVVMELIKHNGVLASHGAGQPSLLRGQRMCKGLRLLIGGIISSLFFLFFSNMGGVQEGVAKLAITLSMAVALVGLVRFVIAYLKDDDSPVTTRTPASSGLSAMAAQMGANVGGAALPPAQGTTVADWRPKAQTAEMARPSSVTENTTKLLDDEAVPRRD